MKFTHLHVHSHYSLLDGLAKIDDLVNKAAQDGMPALALTDHGVMHGAIEFYQKCQKAGIKPIIGVEAYLSKTDLNIKQADKEKRYHLILLAKNDQGYKNLVKLTTIAHLQGFYYKPRIDWQTLAKYKEGLICSSACLAGEVADSILNVNDDKHTEEVIKKYQELFGKENYYLEVQHHPNLPKQKIVNNKIFELGKKLNVPIIATNDVHYLNTQDAEAHDILICLQTKKKITDTNRMSYLGEDFSMYTTAQMQDFFRGNPQVIENTQRITEAVNLNIKLGEIQLPHYELPAGVNDFEYLAQMCRDGIKMRYGFDAESPKTEEENKVVQRMEYELSVIEKTGYASYFLITQDFINWAKSEGIVVGPGRGSAAGSLVAYLTQITNLDPLSYDLLFERFLNPDRISMPDIDTDFADIRREEVLRYCERKYGKDSVAQIITFGTMAARAAVRDVGRVLDMPYAFCDKISKLIPMGMNLDNALNQAVELKDLYQANADAKRLIDFAKKLEGVARHASTHACGVVITPKPLTEYLPTQYSTTDGESVITQYSLGPVEALGLLKMDFLGLKNLTIMERACEIIEKIHGKKIDLDNLKLDDEKSFELFQRGKTTGVFQFESSGMKRYLKMLKPSEFEDLIAMVALYRPGPLNSGMVDEFIDRKHGDKEITYLHPIMKNSLNNTYGVIVYQEQVMQLSKDMAGFTGGQADTLRKAMGKKIAELMEKMKTEFLSGCEKNKISAKIALQTFESMEKFAEYGFNKSHAACYAFIAYQTAYLKANYPAEFMAALLTSDQENMDRVSIEIDECRQLGIKVLPPDINESYTDFTVVAESLQTNDPRIRFGLKAIRNVGHGIVKAIIKERRENGKFESLEDFLGRVKSKDLNKKSIEGLAKSGAFDNLLENRNQIIENIDKILLFIKAINEEENSCQGNMFAMAEGGVATKLNLVDIPKAKKAKRLSWEKEFLGLYVSEHPFWEFYDKLAGKISFLHEIKTGKMEDQQVMSAGVITHITKKVTKKGDPMLFVRLEDHLAGLEILVFPRTYQEFENVFKEENILLINGNVSSKDAEPKILINSVWPINQQNLQQALDSAKVYQPARQARRKIIIKYPQGATPRLAQQVKVIFNSFPGGNNVFLSVVKKLVKTNFEVKYCEKFKDQIEELLGKGSVILK